MRSLSRSRAVLLLALCLAGVIPETALGATPGIAADPAAAGPRATTDGPAWDLGDLVATASRALGSIGEVVDESASAIMGAQIAGGPCSGSGGLSYGSDGRLTILLLGSDYRPSPYIGERMDVIIVATRTSSGRVAIASIPRDTVRFPLAGGGTSGSDRVNALYYRYKRNKSKLARVECGALLRFKRDVEAALATEIDYYAMVRMHTFTQLVDNVDHVRTDIPGPIDDPYYGRRGAYFPDKDDYRLEGNTACRRKPYPCHSALAYVRSRHGTQAGGLNNDFRRAYRQHQFIFDAAMRVRARGTGSALSSLMRSIRGKVWTNVPKTLSTGLAIYGLLGGISMSSSDRIVFGPTGYARSQSSPLYSYRLRLKPVRAWIDAHFGS